MKNSILTAFVCFIGLSINSYATITTEKPNGDKENIEVERTNELKGKILTNKKEIDAVLNEYLAVTYEGGTQFIYNPMNESLVMYFKEGISQLEVTGCKVTNDLTNVYMSINEDIKLHITYVNNSDEILDVRVRKYYPEWHQYFEVVTN